jgi:hypothetical protein
VPTQTRTNKQSSPPDEAGQSAAEAGQSAADAAEGKAKAATKAETRTEDRAETRTEEAGATERDNGGFRLPGFPTRVRLPMPMPSRLLSEPAGKRLLWIGGLGVMAAVELLEWPVALAVGAGSLIAERLARESGRVAAGHPGETAER